MVDEHHLSDPETSVKRSRLRSNSDGDGGDMNCTEWDASNAGPLISPDSPRGARPIHLSMVESQLVLQGDWCAL